MHQIEIPAISFHKEIPSSFNEMRQQDFIRFSYLYLELQKGVISMSQLKTEMIFQFLDIRFAKLKFELIPETKKEIIYNNVLQLVSLLDFLFIETKTDDGNIGLKVNMPWQKNLVPTFSGYIGPKDIMNDLSFLEYKNAHVASIEFLQSQIESDLNWFVATLYRKPLFKWLKKPSYDEFKTHKISEKISGWPLSVKYSILLNFLAWEENIRSGFFSIDGLEISFSILFDSSESSDIGTGLTGLLFSIAETGVFGNVKSTSEQNIYDILFRLYQVQHEKLAFDKKMKSRK